MASGETRLTVRGGRVRWLVVITAEAERACVGALVHAPELLRAVPRLRARHFADPALRTVFGAVVRAEAQMGAAPDSLVVLAELAAAGELKGQVTAGLLADLMAGVPTVANVAWYGQLVLDGARRRALLAAAESVRQDATVAVDEDDLTERMARAVVSLEELAEPQSVTGAGGVKGFSPLSDFLSADEADDSRWVVPGLVRSGERVVVVAAEGAGKTTLARALATATAAGRHFLSPDVRIPPARTLMIDLENPPGLIRAKTRPMVEHLRSWGAWSDAQQMAWLWTRPGGVNLRDPADLLLLERVVEEARPALICIGPVYKTFVEGGGDRAAQAVREVLAALDRLRERHGVALWIEHHAPMDSNGARALRPFGSQLWLAWPEFGIALRRPKDNPRALILERWRGDRDEREWPSRIERSASGWPWAAVWDGGVPAWMTSSPRAALGVPA